MRRVKLGGAAAALDADMVVAMAKPRRGKRPSDRARSSLRAFAKAADEAVSMREGGDWSAATANHLVALYAWFHEQVYKVADAELVDGRSFWKATAAADKLLRDEFGGESMRAVEYIAWCWVHERNKLKKPGTDPLKWRITWQGQLVSRRLLTDYRIDLVRGRAQ